MREVYIRLAYKALKEGIEIVGPSYFSNKLGVSKPTAQEALIKLAEKNYGDYIPKKGFKLNREGIEKAKEITMKHRLMECLFYELGMSPEVACQEATRLEEHVSTELVTQLRLFFGDRKLCPCGNKIEEEFEDLEVEELEEGL
ncbi:metal-dependent transcriptional regulator [Archaeoglobales archaeon]|nr:MAG: metal-dependent transcriptional regulator [Archaeoglobales archaeon]